MNRKVLIRAAAFAAVLVLGAGLWWPTGSPDQATVTQLLAENSQTHVDPHSLPNDEQSRAHIRVEQGNNFRDREEFDEAAMGEADRRAAALETMRDHLRQAQRQPGNLRSFFQELNRLCRGNNPGDTCEVLLAEILADYPDPAFAALVERIFQRMPLYEQAMQQTRMSTSIPAEERFNRIHSVREQTLGIAETEAMFGQENAWANYQFRYGELQQQAQHLAPEARLAALENLRTETFGEHAEALKQVEGPRGAYERERNLLLAGVQDPQERQRITHELRVSHFGTEQASVMAERDKREAQQQARVADYQQALSELQQKLDIQRDIMPAEEWEQMQQQRLRELRLEHFPADQP